MSPFRPQLGPDALIEGVATVLRAADEQRPATVSESAFDAHRERVAGMPEARTAARRLGLSWERLREIALLPDGQRARILGIARRRDEAPPSEEAIRHALRTAVETLGVRTLRPHEYAAFHADLEARQQRAWKHGRPTAPLPSLNQILTATKWDAALAAAALDPSPAPGSKRGEDPAVIAAAFVEAFGSLPANRTQLERWAKDSGVALARFSRRWSEISKEITEQRKAAGLPALVKAPRDLVTDPEQGAPRAPGAAARRRKRWSQPQVIEGMALALDELPPGDQLSERRLNDMARGRPEIPNFSALQSVGLGLEQAKRRAEALRRVVGPTSDMA
ncbi:MAG: hypothetical protein JWP75_3044 [Frondihabitans sp.]|nr:hypothetical protein [Frondihabitans sp.]